MKFVVFLALLAVAAARPTKRYDGYKVLEIIPKTKADLALLTEWQAKFDFWLEPTTIGNKVHLMVAPQHQYYVRSKLLASGIPHSLHVADVQKNIDRNFNEIENLRAKRPETQAFDYNNFNTFADYLTELNALVAACPAGFSCSTYSIGTTVENRPMQVLRVSKDGAPAPRYNIWYDSQIHAREWLAGATLMKVIDRLIRQYSTDATSRRLLDSYDWYFLPVMNPDGYQYTWDTDRYWRKNRGPTSGTCVGTDLNRNYPYHWGQAGASGQPCSDTYYGLSSASERETQAVNNYAATIKTNLVTWINFHTYGQYWLSPWGDCTVPSDHTTHQVPVTNAACNAIEATYGTTWACGNSCQVLYETSGGIIDQMKSAHGVRWAYTPEMRGNDFVVPPGQIDPSYTEIWNGLVAMFNQMESIGLP